MLLFLWTVCAETVAAQKMPKCPGGDVIPRDDPFLKPLSRSRAVEKFLVEKVLSPGDSVLYMAPGNASPKSGPFDVVSLSNVILTKRQFPCVLKRLVDETRVGSLVYLHKDRTDEGVSQLQIVRSMFRVGLELQHVEYDRDIECSTIEEKEENVTAAENRTYANCYDTETHAPRYIHLLFKRTVATKTAETSVDSSPSQTPAVSTRETKKGSDKQPKKKSSSMKTKTTAPKEEYAKKKAAKHDPPRSTEATTHSLSAEDEQKISKVLRDPSLLALSGI